jgi:flagellar hook-basal body complex protein FliE
MSMFNGIPGASDSTNVPLAMRRTHPAHMTGQFEPLHRTGGERSFQDALVGSLNDVNQLQRAHEELSIQAIIATDSVEAHDLTIAAAKANTSLSITRNIVDRVIQAYRDITNLR